MRGIALPRRVQGVAAIGTGTPMFGGPFTATGFAVADSGTFESGAVVVTYTRV